MVLDAHFSTLYTVCDVAGSFLSTISLIPPPFLSCQPLSGGFPSHRPSLRLLAWALGRYELQRFVHSLQRFLPLWALACWWLDNKHPPPPTGKTNKVKSKYDKSKKMSGLNRFQVTWILAMMSATLTTGSWVISSLLCAFILLFSHPMPSFTHFSTMLISSGLKCTKRSSWKKIKVPISHLTLDSKWGALCALFRENNDLI